jgi:hypothetical protein
LADLSSDAGRQAANAIIEAFVGCHPAFCRFAGDNTRTGLIHQRRVDSNYNIPNEVQI